MASETSYSQNLRIQYEIQRLLAPFSKKECKINLAQLVVIGDQSTGKSALLTLLTQIPFPSKCGITTKRPIVAHTRQNKALDKSKFFILTRGKDKKELDPTQVAKFLSDGQDDVKNATVTEEPVTIEVEGPDCENLTLVDLPGIIHDNPQTKTAVINMIKQYIEPDQTLILVVTEASKDDEMHTALTLARDFDPEGERTLRVLNKFDVFDSDESRKRAQDLVCKTQNDTLGCHAVVCRPDGKEYKGKSEEEHKWHSAPSHRFGLQALQKRLPILLSELIRKNLPTLQQQIRDVKQEKRRVLEKIGLAPPSRTIFFKKIRAYLREIYERLRKMSQGPVREMHKSLQDTKDFITMEKVEDEFYHDYFTPAVFQGIPTFKRLQKLQVYDSWQPIVNKLCSNLGRVAEACIVADITGPNPTASASAVGAEASYRDRTIHQAIQLKRHLPMDLPKRVLEFIGEEWKQFAHETVMPELLAESEKELAKEIHFKTVNHYMNSESISISHQTIQRFTDGITMAMLTTHQPNINPTAFLSAAKNKLRQHLKACIEQQLQTYGHKELEDQQKERVLHAIHAYWGVSHKNLADNLLCVVRNHFLDKFELWISDHFFMKIEKINDIAVESKHITRERAKCLEILAVCKRCEDKLGQIQSTEQSD